MEDKNRILFSAQRQVVRRKVKYFQRILSICLLVCATYLVWYRMDSREVARKNQELQQIARQTMEERQRDTGEDSGKTVGRRRKPKRKKRGNLSLRRRKNRLILRDMTGFCRSIPI